jgi:hypothetical protein
MKVALIAATAAAGIRAHVAAVGSDHGVAVVVVVAVAVIVTVVVVATF